MRGPFQAGDACNNYTIVRSLGIGGCGHVYEAVRDIKLLTGGELRSFPQPVALKCLRVDNAADPDHLERLNRETALLLTLRHPNIVGFVDCGITNDGTTYVAMELLHGKTLSQASKERLFSIARTLYVAGEIAEGLAYAHEQGIIHRDLKPQNVFVTDEWDIKILDLGAAKIEGAWTVPTTPGQLPPYTAPYAAPEQFREGEVDGLADVFALGVITYQMLVRRHPFSEGVKGVMQITVCQHTCAPPTPLVDKGVPGYIAELVHRALSPKAADRPTMREFLAGLRAAYSHYVEAGAYEDPSLVEARKLRRARARAQESSPLGVPAVVVVKDGTPTEVFALRPNAAPPDRMSASLSTRSAQIAVVAPRARRGGWARVGRFYEELPASAKLSAAGMLVLPLGIVIAGWARRAEVHAAPKPPPAIAAPSPEALAPLPDPEPSATTAPPSAPSPPPKPRQSPLHGIHAPRWNALSPPSKSLLLEPE